MQPHVHNRVMAVSSGCFGVLICALGSVVAGAVDLEFHHHVRLFAARALTADQNVEKHVSCRKAGSIL